MSDLLYTEIASKIKEYLSILIRDSTSIIGSPPCNYSVMGLGSLTLKQMTPYSDLEFAFITENDNFKNSDNPFIKNYFKNLCHYINFLVTSLGETIIPESYYNVDMDSFGVRALGYDLGGKTPLGREDKEYELAGTLEQTLTYLTGEYNVTSEKRRDNKISRILENTCYVCDVNEKGEIYFNYELSLIKLYHEKVAEYLSSPSNEEFISEVRVLTNGEVRGLNPLIKQNTGSSSLDKYEFNSMESEGNLYNVKDEIYRYIDRITYNLGIIYGLHPDEDGIGGIEIIDDLIKLGVIDFGSGLNVKKAISYTKVLRLRVYEFYKSQTNALDIYPSEDDREFDKNRFKISECEMTEEGAFFEYYYYDLEFIKRVKEFLQEIKFITLDQKLNFFKNDSFVSDNEELNAEIYLRLSRYNESLKIYNKISEKFNNDNVQDRTKSLILRKIGKIYLKSQNYHKAIENFQKSLDLMSKMNATVIDLIYLNDDLGSALFYIGNYSHAQQYAETAMNLYKSLTDNGEHDFCFLFNNLGNIYQKLKKSPKLLEEYYQKNLDLKQKLYGLESKEVSIAYNNFGYFLKSIGQFAKAIEYHLIAYKIIAEIKSEYHFAYFKLLDNLGDAVEENGNIYESLILKNRALQIALNLFGEESIETAESYESVSSNYAKLKQFESGEKLKLEAIKIMLGYFGTEQNLKVATSYNNLGYLYFNMANYSGAKPVFDKVLKIRNSIYKSYHEDIAHLYGSLGWVDTYLNLPESSLTYFTISHDLHLRLYGNSFYNLLPIKHGIANALLKLKKYDLALEYLNETIYLSEEMEQPKTKLAQYYLTTGKVYSALKNFKLSEVYYLMKFNLDLELNNHNLDNLGSNLKFDKSNNTILEISYKTIFDFYINQGLYTKALDYHSSYLNIMESLYGTNDVRTLNARVKIGDLYFNIKNFYQAIYYYSKACLKAQEQTLITKCFKMLLKAYYETKEYKLLFDSFKNFNLLLGKSSDLESSLDDLHKILISGNKLIDKNEILRLFQNVYNEPKNEIVIVSEESEFKDDQKVSYESDDNDSIEDEDEDYIEEYIDPLEETESKCSMVDLTYFDFGKLTVQSQLERLGMCRIDEKRGGRTEEIKFNLGNQEEIPSNNFYLPSEAGDSDESIRFTNSASSAGSLALGGVVIYGIFKGIKYLKDYFYGSEDESVMHETSVIGDEAY